MNRRAFTLVELLVVIAIIGLLSTVAVAATNSARTKSRDTKRLADIAQIRKALELYYANNNSYPPSDNGAVSPNNAWSNSGDASWATLQSYLSPYIATLPKDPSQSSSGWPADPNTYGYAYFSRWYGCDMQFYVIVYQLEVADGKPDPSFTNCVGDFVQYGGSGSSTKIKTIGQKAGI